MRQECMIQWLLYDRMLKAASHPKVLGIPATSSLYYYTMGLGRLRRTPVLYQLRRSRGGRRPPAGPAASYLPHSWYVPCDHSFLLRTAPPWRQSRGARRPSCPHTPYVSTACRDTANGQPRQPLRTVVQLSPPTANTVLPCGLASCPLLLLILALLLLLLSLASSCCVATLGGPESSLYFSRLASDARCPACRWGMRRCGASFASTFFLLTQNELSPGASTLPSTDVVGLQADAYAALVDSRVLPFPRSGVLRIDV
jgi:hypothetical protein